MKYLGIPVSTNRLGIQAFSGIVDKMRNKLDPWKGKSLSSGGRLILTNSCLSNLPKFTMGFYLLPKSTHKNLDQIRGNFFWKGASDDFKYHMAKMDTICRPKNQGGLGMINTKHMNDSLLVKWIWKILKAPNTTWYKLLKAKYMPSGNFFCSKVRGSSQFWQGIHKVKHLFKWGAIHKVGNGLNTFFWSDIWLNDTLLKTQFPNLYSMSRFANALVADNWIEDEWQVEFRRSLTPI